MAFCRSGTLIAWARVAAGAPRRRCPPRGVGSSAPRSRVGRGRRRRRDRRHPRRTRSGSSSASGTGSATCPPPTPPARTSATSAAGATTSGGYRWTPSWRTRSAAWARTTSPTTTCRAATPTEEPAWTHSLEMRLLAHTGVVGFVLFAGFIVAARGGGARGSGDARRAPRQWVAGAALLPLVVWLIHGSVDWFWEMPALSGPALGFLGDGAARWAPARRGRRRSGGADAGPPAVRALGRRRGDRAGGRGGRARLPLPVGPREVCGGSGPRPRSSAALDDLAHAGRAQSAERRSRPHSAARSRCRAATTTRPTAASASRSHASPAAGSPGSAPAWPPRRWATPTRPASDLRRWRHRSTSATPPSSRRSRASTRPSADARHRRSSRSRWSTRRGSPWGETVGPNRYSYW